MARRTQATVSEVIDIENQDVRALVGRCLYKPIATGCCSEYEDNLNEDSWKPRLPV